MAYRSNPHSYILLSDKSEDHPRGKLLELNEDGSYRGHSHTWLSLIGHIRCDNDGDVAPLSGVECDILYGILSDDDRYEVYNTPGKLEWGRSLKVGDTLLARLPGGEKQHQYTTVIIRWCGKIKDIYGDILYLFGVEIVVSSYVYIPSCIEIV